MLVISIIVPVIIIVSLIFLMMIKVRTNSDEGGSTKMRHTYMYFVLFATLMMTIGGSVSVFMAVADLISPAPYYQSFEEYRQWGPNYEEEKIKNKTEEELLESYQEIVRMNEQQEKARAKNTLIKSFGWIVIPLPIFIYFQRKLPKKQ